MRKKAFTLIEMIVVISVIALLTAILMPALAKARQRGKSIACLSNLRQIGITAQMYTQTYDGYYPISRYTSPGVEHCWDFTIVNNSGNITVKPGILWHGEMIEEIQQCPSFKGNSSTPNDPYTGYNYNTSYVGHGEGETIETPSKINQVKKPDNCALFGDGQWNGGANKFMRSPLKSSADDFNFRYAGTQGYRHDSKTNVVWCDGHVSAQKQLYTNIEPARFEAFIEPCTGFLSLDNSAYDLE